MYNTLHILNGDSTLHSFQECGIEGDTFVWKDVLSDGPVHPEFNSKAFWEQRDQFMTATFQLKAGQYGQEVTKPFKKVADQLDQYQEVVLWFEYDLFCQINMIALIHWLSKLDSDLAISLVCVGKIDDSDNLYGLGEIAPEKYPEFYEKRLKLGTREFTFASDVYETYCSDQPEDLYTFILMPFPDFPYLADALESHFKRFPNMATGFTEIEQKMVDLIKSGITDHRKLIGNMLRWQLYYGFGDLQYFQILERLRPLFSDFEKLSLKDNLDKKTVESLIDRNYILGGAKVADWYWDDQEKTLIQTESAS